MSASSSLFNNASLKSRGYPSFSVYLIIKKCIFSPNIILWFDNIATPPGKTKKPVTYDEMIAKSVVEVKARHGDRYERLRYWNGQYRIQTSGQNRGRDQTGESSGRGDEEMERLKIRKKNTEAKKKAAEKIRQKRAAARKEIAYVQE